MLWSPFPLYLSLKHHMASILQETLSNLPSSLQSKEPTKISGSPVLRVWGNGHRTRCAHQSAAQWAQNPAFPLKIGGLTEQGRPESRTSPGPGSMPDFPSHAVWFWRLLCHPVTVPLHVVLWGVCFTYSLVITE